MRKPSKQSIAVAASMALIALAISLHKPVEWPSSQRLGFSNPGGGFVPPTKLSTGSSGVGGSGTANTVPKWNGASTLTNSNITDDGTTTTVNGLVLDINNDLQLFGTDFGETYINNNALDCLYNTDADGTCFINQLGYQAGTTRFRDLAIYNGKNVEVASFVGSDKTLRVIGGLRVGSSGAPATTLHVRGTGGSSGITPAAGTVATIENTSSDNYISMLVGSSNGQGINFGNTTNAIDGNLTYTSARALQLRTGGNATRFEADVNGSIFMGDAGNTTVANNVDVLTVGNSGTGQTVDTRLITVSHNGSFDTTGAGHTVYGVRSFLSATRSAGANVFDQRAFEARLTNGVNTNYGVLSDVQGAASNIAFYANATGGTPYSFYGNAGTLFNAANTQLGDAGSDLIGIGTAPSADAVMTFPAATGDKIHLYPVNSTSAYGFGVDSGRLQIFTQNNTTAIGLGYGDSGAFTPLLTIDGDATATATIVGSLSTTATATLGDALGDTHTINGSVNITSAYTSGGGTTGNSGDDFSYHFGIVRMGDTATTAIDSNLDVLTIGNTGTGQTTTSALINVSTSSATFTPAAGVSLTGVKSYVTATRSGGAGTLTNIGADFSASGADANLALRTVSGDVSLNTTSGATTAFGNLTVGDNSGTDTLTVKQGTAPTGLAGAPSGAVIVVEQANSTAAYIAFRNNSTIAGLAWANSGQSADGALTYNQTGRSMSFVTANTTRFNIDANGAFMVGDTAGTAVADNVDIVTIANTGTGQTTTGKMVLNVANTGSYNTTGGNVTYYGGNFDVSATESAGSNTLNGVALRASATNGDTPTGLWVDNGDALLDDKVYVANEGVTVSSCGTGASVSGNEFGGVITPGTGAPTACTLNFTVAFRGSYPSCVAMLEGVVGTLTINASGGGGITTSLVTFTSSVSLAGDKRIHYHCLGRP